MTSMGIKGRAPLRENSAIRLSKAMHHGANDRGANDRGARLGKFPSLPPVSMLLDPVEGTARCAKACQTPLCPFALNPIPTWGHSKLPIGRKVSQSRYLRGRWEKKNLSAGGSKRGKGAEYRGFQKVRCQGRKGDSRKAKTYWQPADIGGRWEKKNLSAGGSTRGIGAEYRGFLKVRGQGSKGDSRPAKTYWQPADIGGWLGNNNRLIRNGSKKL
ncbi:hypothetical protein Acr_08g0005210 [Actinidia rufa]|uniref:Uncharacterized protein n=1 Tax=Actinidia rufa TaxID=165716 RepID=A0A7J0F0A5_9ERIC|nr:hypothetical protein Acr_08g0005210 [Actinidia rufa]